MAKPKKPGVFADVLIVSHSAGGALAKCLRSLVSERQYIGRVLIYENGGSSPVLCPQTGLDSLSFLRQEPRFWRGMQCAVRPFVRPLRVVFEPRRPIAPRQPVENAPGAQKPLRLRRLRLRRCGRVFEHEVPHRPRPMPSSPPAQALPAKRTRPVPGTPTGCWGPACWWSGRPSRRPGGFDEGFFLFFEETDLCLRLKALGHDTYYCAQARAEHAGGGSEKIRPMRAFRPRAKPPALRQKALGTEGVPFAFLPARCCWNRPRFCALPCCVLSKCFC